MSAITMILCHGTDANFEEFNLSECNYSGAFGRGYYFSNDVELEQEYSNGLNPVVAEVTLQNPCVLDKSISSDQWLAATRVFRPVERARERLIGLGYDGVLLRQDTFVEVVAFYPRQIRSYGRRPDLSTLSRGTRLNLGSFFKLEYLLSCFSAAFPR